MKKPTKKTRHSYFNRLIRTHGQLITLCFAALAVLLILLLSTTTSRVEEMTGTKRLVTIYDGKQYSVLTSASTVREALKVAKVEISSKDATDPTIDTPLEESHIDIIVYRSRPVYVIDGSIRQTVMTVAQSPNKILQEANLQSLGVDDKTTFKSGSLETRGADVLNIERTELEPEPVKPAFIPNPNALTRSKGAHIFVDSAGVAHRETYYDLPMNIVIKACGPNGSYTVRPEDGAKVDQDGYVLVAAGFSAYPRCTIVETSMGLGKVYDTGGFALRHPYGFDLATDWTNFNGL